MFVPALLQCRRAPRTPHPALARAVVLVAVAACPAAWAQDAAPSGGRGLAISSSVETAIIATDGGANAGAGGRRDLALQLRPGFNVTSRSGRVQGSLSYSADLIQHSRKTESSDLQNFLNASLRAEAVPGTAYVDATASVTQRALSPFGRQSAQDSFIANDNRTEVGTLSLSPSLQGRLGDVATLEARLNASATNGRRSKSADSTSAGGSVSLASASRGTVFGWGLTGSRQHADFRAGRSTSTDRVVASLSASPDIDLRLTLRAGQEWTNIESLERKRYDNWGGQLQWTPTPRTQLDANVDRRFFGNSRQIRFSHRLPLSTLSFSSTRDISTSTDPTGVGQPVSKYLLYFSLFSSIQPDPALREQLVRDFLAATNQDGNETVGGGFVNSGVTLQRREDLAWTYAGRRLSLTLQAYQSQTEIFDGPQAEGPVRQTGYTASANYRLTPTASANLVGSRLMTPSTLLRTGTDLKSLSVGWTDQLGRRTAVSLSLRYSVFNSTTDPYHETAARGSVSLRF